MSKIFGMRQHAVFLFGVPEIYNVPPAKSAETICRVLAAGLAIPCKVTQTGVRPSKMFPLYGPSRYVADATSEPCNPYSSEYRTLSGSNRSLKDYVASLVVNDDGDTVQQGTPPDFVECWVAYDLNTNPESTQMTSLFATRSAGRAWLQVAKARSAVPQTAGLVQCVLGLSATLGINKHQKSKGPLLAVKHEPPKYLTVEINKDFTRLAIRPSKVPKQVLATVDIRSYGCQITYWSKGRHIKGEGHRQNIYGPLGLGLRQAILRLSAWNDWPDQIEVRTEWKK